MVLTRGWAVDRGVFINYRGEDTHSYGALLYTELVRQFGADHVFLDAESIPAGADFVEELLDRVQSARVLLAVIGPRWLTATDSAGRRRIDDPGDWIHRELVEAFTAGVRVIPVLTEQAELPTTAQLPADIAALSRCQYRRLRYREPTADLARIVTDLVSVDPVLAEAARSRDGAAHGKPVSPGRGQTGPRPPGMLPPVWNVGPRNPRFVGRGVILSELQERLHSGGTAVVQALHGMGGVGKTQVAIEYAHRYAGAYDIAWWISAEETSLIGEQYVALALALGLVSPGTGTASTVNALRAYLRSQDRWLLLLDNAESPGDVQDWLPAGPGHTLITSRHPGWGELATRVEIDILPRPESVELLRVSHPDIREAEADHLAEVLGDLPLALTQAAGFLAETGMSVVRYLGLLATCAQELLDQSPPQTHPRSLAAVIRMSIDHLAQVDLAALALVRIGAFLAPEPIPSDILTQSVTVAGHDQPPELAALTIAMTNPIAAHRSLGRIGRYGLARIDHGLQLHRLTQVIVCSELTDDDAAAYHAYAEALLVAVDPGETQRDPASWPNWARILPHLLAVNPASSTSPDLRDLACRAAWYLYIRGDIHPARELAEHLHQQWRNHLGPDHEHTLRVASTLVRFLVNSGLFSQARRLGEETFVRSRQVLGEDHPDTMHAAHYLADCLHELDEFEQARKLNADNLIHRRRVLGDDHLDVHRSAQNLARDLRKLGDVETARQLHEEGLTYRRRIFGNDHPQTIINVNELGLDLYLLGQLDTARRLHADNLARARRMLGEDHIWTMNCANNLMVDLHALGKLDTARHLGEKTLARAQRALGDMNHHTMDIANNLATILQAAGEFEAARQLSADTLVRARNVFGETHSRARKAAGNLATALRCLSETEPAGQRDSG